jgi:2-methylcitrate dehydratase PrpD
VTSKFKGHTVNHEIDRRRLMLGLLSGSAALASPLVTAQNVARQPAATTKTVQAANWSEPLTRYIVESQTAPLPEETVELAKRHILDTLAAIVACRDLDAATLARRFALVQSAGAKTAPILGTRERAALLDAILASAMCTHAAEINDFCPSAFVQPSASIIPATLCVGATRNSSGSAFLRSMIVGYEVACRFPKALGIRNLNTAVLANHSVGPIFGTAAAVASLVGIPAERMNHVYSYCVQQASGSWQWLRDIEHIEKAFVFGGMPARRGTESALFAEAGFTGIGDPFGGDPGWLNSSMFTGPNSDFDASKLTHDLGKKFELPLVGYKKYPVGGPTQPVIEQMLQLVKRVDAKRVRKVRIEMPGRTAAFASAAMPALNLPYLCTIILLDGKLDFVAAQSRQRFLNDTVVRAFMPNVAVIHDPAQEASPRIESARVILTMDDGAKVESFLDHVEGFPEHPMDRSAVQAKARGLMTPRLGAKRVEQAIDLVWDIESQANLKKLIGVIAT